MTLTMDVILIEANKYHALLVERSIVEQLPGARVLWWTNLKGAALAKLDQGETDLLVIADHYSAEPGLAQVRSLRIDQPKLPVILLTSDSGDLSENFGVDSQIFRIVGKSPDFHEKLPMIILDMIMIDQEPESVGEVPTADEQKLIDILQTVAETLAHEISNPLMSIMGTTELILSQIDSDNDEVGQKMLIIQDSARRIDESLARLSRSNPSEMEPHRLESSFDPENSVVPVTTADK